AAVASEAGGCWAQVGIPDRALDAYGRAISATADGVGRLLLAARRAPVHENAGRFPQALSLYTRAMSEAGSLPAEQRERLLGILHSGRASTRQRQGRLQEAIEQAVTAAKHAEAAGDRQTLALVYHMLDRLHMAIGDRDTAIEYRDAALPIFAELGDLASQGTVLHDLAADAHRGGRLEEAAWLYERAIDARTRAGDVVRAAASINALGEVELATGEADRAEGRFSEALRTWRGARSPEGVIGAATNLARVHLRRDRPDLALESLVEAGDLADRIGADSLLPAVQLLQAEAYASLSRWVEAWEAATTALHGSLEKDDHIRALNLRADALEATGSQARAEQEREQAQLVASSTPEPA